MREQSNGSIQGSVAISPTRPRREPSSGIPPPAPIDCPPAARRVPAAGHERPERWGSAPEPAGSNDQVRCPGRPPSSTSVDARDAIAQLVALATRLLAASADEMDAHGSDPITAAPEPALRRVARLRNELHVTANRIARFGTDEHPTIDAVQIPETTAVGAMLAPRLLLFRLDLTVERLQGLLSRLTADDWVRVGRIGDRSVTLGAIVDEVVQRGVHDLLDIAHPPPSDAQRAPR